MEKIYQISNHPTFTTVKRELLFNRFVEDPISSTAKVVFIKKHYTLIGDVKTPILGMPDSEDELFVSNNKMVDPLTGIKVEKVDGEYPIGSIAEYDFFSAMVESGMSHYAVIAMYVPIVDSASWPYGFNNK